MSADNFETVSEYLCGLDFHGGIVKVYGNEMSLDALLIDLLEKVISHSEVDVANSLDGKSDGVFARVKYSVLSGYVILKLKEIVSIFEFKYVLGFSGVN